MAISDLQARQGKVDLVFEITDKEEPRQFEKFGKSGRVCNAVAKDDSGSIKLTLWNDDCDKVNVGDKVKLTNGFVSEWQGEKQLSTGKFGKLEVVEKGTGKSEGSVPAAPVKAKQASKEDDSSDDDDDDSSDEDDTEEESVYDEEV